VMTSYFARRTFYEVALEERTTLGKAIGEDISSELKALGTGLEVVDVVVKDVHPPRDVARSFEGVVAAMQDHQTLVNEAYSYRSRKIPEARSDAVRRVATAHAYVADNKIRSEGDATRFQMRRQAYSVNRWVTRQRLYIDAMVRALSGRRKVVISPACGTPDLWLDDTVAAPPRAKRKGKDGESSRRKSKR